MSQGRFLQSVIVLVGGAAFAHCITALALPILSRLYLPTDFGLLAVFSSVLSIIAVAACLRFDVAIPLPESEDDALNLLMLAVGCVTVVAAGLALAVMLWPEWMASKLKQPQLASYMWLLPLGVFLSGIYSSLQHWFVRRSLFKLIARSRVAQSTASAGTQLGMGWLGMSPLGLLIGYVMNTGMACLMLAGRPLREMISSTKRYPDWHSMRSIFKRYDRFAKYSTFEALCNSAAVQLPIVMIAVIAAPAEAGFLSMAMAVMQAPMALIGAAVGQVYLSRAPAEYRAKRLDVFTIDTLRGLFKAGLGPILAAGILAPVAFGLVFGSNWGRAGWLVSWMTPWFLMQFLSSPISMALHITGNQRIALVLQIFGLLLRTAIVIGVSKIAPFWVSEAYALSGGIFYFVYLMLVLKIIKASILGILGALVQGLIPAIIWVSLAVSGAFLLAVASRMIS